MDSDDGRNSACRAAAGPPAQGFPIPPPLKKTARHPAGSSPVALSPVARELPFARRRKAKSEEREGAVCQDEVRDGRVMMTEVPRRRCVRPPARNTDATPDGYRLAPRKARQDRARRTGGRIGGAWGWRALFSPKIKKRIELVHLEKPSTLAPATRAVTFVPRHALTKTHLHPSTGRLRLFRRPLGFRRRVRPSHRRPLGMVRRPRKRHAPPRARADGRRPPPALAHACPGVGARGSDVAWM